jgi:DivIVA domain-containing protein
MDEAAAMPTPAPSAASRMLTPLDIQQKEFRVATRGYKMRDVDEFLDQLTDAMSAVLAENERLRTGAPAGPAIGTADLDDTNRQADEIIQRARDEAARIVADAKGQAAIAAGVGVGSSADRAAVSAFLAKEREFLQSLAGLVQGHAESVKGMAKAARQAPTEARTTAAAPSRATPEEAVAPEPASEERAGPAGSEASIGSAASTGSEAGERVVIQEPEPASIGRAETNEPAEGDDALRELFWGED